MPELKINGYTFATQADGNNPVLASNVNLGSATFPAGHVIRTFYDDYNFNGSNVGVGSETIWTGLELDITNPSVTNYLALISFIPSVASDNAIRSLRLGFVYSTDNWSTNSTLGSGLHYEERAGYSGSSSTWLTFVSYPVTIITRFNHPTSSNYKIRLKLTPNDYCYIGYNAINGPIATMYAQEIKG